MIRNDQRRKTLFFPITALLLILAILCFYLGITQPLMVFERLFFWEAEASLLGILHQLWVGEDWFLAIIVGLFSVLFPIAKLGYLGVALLWPQQVMNKPWFDFLSTVSKWSMLDVLVVAILIVATKTSGIAKAFTQPGIWYFTASIVLMAIVTILLQRRPEPVID